MYRLIIAINRVALFFFFKKILVVGRKNIEQKGPLIVVANHPNTLMDPLIIASILPQKLGFLAKIGLFSNPLIGAFLKFFNVIPIIRKGDQQEGSKIKNSDSFAKCHEYLAKNGTILIFPEGNSFYELKLREIKTGAARIALSHLNFIQTDSEVKILPISLDYSDAIQFCSMVLVNIEEPITVNTLKNSYLNNQNEAIAKLTDEIRQKLQHNIPITENKEEEQLLLDSHTFYTTYIEPSADLYLDPKKSLTTRTALSKALLSLKLKAPNLYQEIANDVNHFFEQLNQENLTTGFFTESFQKKNLFLVVASYILKFVLLFPCYVFGLITNYLPYIIPNRVFTFLKKDIEYKTSIQMVIGLISFPLFYWIEILFLGNYFKLSNLSIIGLVISFVFSGYIAMYFWLQVKRFLRVVHYYYFMKDHHKTEIIKTRDRLIEKINIAESVYDAKYA